MLNTYKLIIFDWDGTLMDSVPRIVQSMQCAADEMALEPVSVESIKNIIGLSLDKALLELWPDLNPERIGAIQKCYGKHFLHQNAQPMAFFEGAVELLDWLVSHPAKPLLAVATGKKRVGLERILNEHNMHRYFAATRCGDESHSKPHPQMLEYLLDKLNIEPKQALMIGDTDYDIHMAQAAGINSLAVTYGAHNQECLEAAHPNLLCDSVQQIRQYLEN